MYRRSVTSDLRDTCSGERGMGGLTRPGVRTLGTGATGALVAGIATGALIGGCISASICGSANGDILNEVDDPCGRI